MYPTVCFAATAGKATLVGAKIGVANFGWDGLDVQDIQDFGFAFGGGVRESVGIFGIFLCVFCLNLDGLDFWDVQDFGIAFGGRGA